MNITRESIDELTEVLKISINPEDYSNQVEAELRKVRKNMVLPGFRPGHVPAGLVKKKYGKAVLIDELNKIVSGSLEEFIAESKLDLLGSPIPQPDGESGNNFDEPGNFEFRFEIGLAPQFDLTIPPDKTFVHYQVEVDEQKVNEYAADLRRKYGKFSNPETADEQSILYGEFVELDDQGTVREEGITSRSTLSLALVKDPSTLSRLIGAKKGDTIRINPAIAFGNNVDEIAHMLNKPVEEIQNVKSDFNYVIDTVNKIEPADLNTEFFDKIYGEGVVTDEAGFMEKIREQIAGFYAQDTDFKLKHDLEDHFLEELNLKLPDTFLKKWLTTSIEKPLTEEQLDKEYPSYARAMKLRLIENKIFQSQQMKISQEEIQEVAKGYILNQFSGYTAGLNEEILQSLVARYLEKRESVERIVETISSRKVFNYLKSVVKTKVQIIKYEDFVELVKAHKHD
jgi:trigger factor